jgi:signal peptidase II
MAPVTGPGPADGPATQPGVSRHSVLVGLVAAGVLAVDQAVKTLALETLADGPVHLIGTLRLKLSFNTGAAFGLGRDVPPVVIAGAGVLLVALVVLARRVHTRPAAIAVGLVLGGALGNLTDRLVRDHGGAVVDFIDLQWWPVFNLADAAITCGTLLLVLAGSRTATPIRQPADG